MSDLPEPTEHPPTFRLDAHAAGDRDARVEAHLEGCDACTTYVEHVRKEAKAHGDAPGAEASARELVATLRDRLDPPAAPAPPRPRASLARAAWAFGPILAAAALFLLLLRGGETDPLRGGPPPPSSTTMRPEPPTRFKGKVQIAVVRDRMGEQTRIATEVPVKPGDRLRVEVSVDDERPIEVGFLGKDGTWVLLLAPTLVEAGTHYSERSARFDETPTEGWILAGAPDLVQRARTSTSFADVSALPVVVER